MAQHQHSSTGHKHDRPKACSKRSSPEVLVLHDWSAMRGSSPKVMHQVWCWCMLQGTQVDDPDVALTRKPSDDEPFSALAFKIMSDAYQGTLTFIRVYSGILEQVSNPWQAPEPAPS